MSIREYATADVVERVTEQVVTLLKISEPVIIDETRKIIATYPADLVAQFQATAAKNELHYSIAALIRSGGSTISIREAMTFSPYLPETNAYFAEVLIRSLHHYPQLPHKYDYSTADELTKKQCAAIIILTKAVYDHVKELQDKMKIITSKTDVAGETAIVIVADELITLLMEKPDAAQQIANIVTDRITIDADLIKSILNHETPALADGIL